eukprot:tig00000189_g14332.t1
MEVPAVEGHCGPSALAATPPPHLTHIRAARVYVYDDAGRQWVDARVVPGSYDQESRTCAVRTHGGQEMRLPYQDLSFANDGPAVEDMCVLSHLNEPAILQNVRARFAADEIYTYTGRILVAVNPFRDVDALYTRERMAGYHGKKHGERPPHIFAVAEEAYAAMRATGTNQSILISGESGAGKTESTKFCMEFLTHAGFGLESRVGQGTPDSFARSIAEQVLESNPILEAFGNARTLRNDNSSRFGKFIEIKFDTAGRVAGARIQTYLLEKSRVVRQSPGERNFHVFYQLCAGADPALRERLRLRPATEFRYLRQGNCFSIEGVSDSEEFARTSRAMEVVGMSGEERESVFRVLAAVLAIGELDFTPAASAPASASAPAAPAPASASPALLESEDGSAGDSAPPPPPPPPPPPLPDGAPSSSSSSTSSSDLIRLQATLCSRRLEARGERYTVHRSLEQCVATRDALAKALYSRLFRWLVDRLNRSISGDLPSDRNCVSILDIFGFECFERNSFEQLCINYANEKLQLKFTADVLKGAPALLPGGAGPGRAGAGPGRGRVPGAGRALTPSPSSPAGEQELYASEGVPWSHVAFKDNQECVDLLEKKREQALVSSPVRPAPPRSAMAPCSHAGSALLERPRLATGPGEAARLLLLRHYAGPVLYDLAGFLEKNRDKCAPKGLKSF